MDVLNLAELLLSPDEKNELHSSMELLEQSVHSAFMRKIKVLSKAFYFLKHWKNFWTFQRKMSWMRNVFVPLFSALTVTVSRLVAMRMT